MSMISSGKRHFISLKCTFFFQQQSIDVGLSIFLCQKLAKKYLYFNYSLFQNLKHITIYYFSTLKYSLFFYCFNNSPFFNFFLTRVVYILFSTIHNKRLYFKIFYIIYHSNIISSKQLEKKIVLKSSLPKGKICFQKSFVQWSYLEK